VEPVPYAKLDNPQTLNLYTYAGDNPESVFDPDGHLAQEAGASGSESVAGAVGTAQVPQSCKNDPDGCSPSQQKNAPTVVVVAQRPTAAQVRAELTSLATSYGVPAAVVLAVAQTESSLNVSAKNENKNTKGHVTSTDYGVMQVNGGNEGASVKGPNGKPFTISTAIEDNWKANANAGVALLAVEWRAAVTDQPNGSQQTRAQQAYSGYNAGPGGRGRYLETGHNGGFADKRDEHFLENYNKEIRH
jgi:hypothetical protein